MQLTRLKKRGKVLNPGNISQALHDDPRSVLQVVGTNQEKLAKPLAHLLMDYFLLPFHFFSQLLTRLIPPQLFDNEVWQSILRLFCAAWSTVSSFFLSAMPGYVPPARDGDRTQDGDELNHRVQRVIQTDGRRCRDEINMEVTDRFDRHPP